MKVVLRIQAYDNNNGDSGVLLWTVENVLWVSLVIVLFVRLVVLVLRVVLSSIAVRCEDKMSVEKE